MLSQVGGGGGGGASRGQAFEVGGGKYGDKLTTATKYSHYD